MTQASDSAATPRRPRWRLKMVVFALLPALLLVGIAEVALRLFQLDRPHLPRVGLMAEAVGLLRPDPDLGWTHAPGFRMVIPQDSGNYRVTTNSLGLRGAAEVGPKGPREVRILSLGESTTFGLGVDDDRTYSALLQEGLARRGDGRTYRVINAGRVAYSTFQSFLYLKLHGLALRPDIVLFYHELNDHLPSTIRASGSWGDAGIGRSDRQVYESTRGLVVRKLLAWSAIFRFLSYRLAAREVAPIIERRSKRPMGADMPRGYRAFIARQLQGGPAWVSDLPRRGPEPERERTLKELVAFCRGRGIRLVLIHPCYAFTVPHTCATTKVAAALKVPMLEALPVLQPPGGKGSLFLPDGVHPNVAGHAALAEALLRFLDDRGLLPPPR